MTTPEQQADLRESDRLSIPAIRARHAASTHPRWRASTDIGALLTEIDRLNAERAAAIAAAKAFGYRLAADNAAECRATHGRDADAEMLVHFLQHGAEVHERFAADHPEQYAATVPSV